MERLTIDQAFQIAVRHHQAGRLRQAEQLYRQILGEQPENPDALHLLGAIAGQVGHSADAVKLLGRAVALRPDWPEAHCNLGNALKDMGQLDQAIAAYRRAIALNSNYPQAHTNLGNALRAKGQPHEAIAAHREAIALKPNYAEAHGNLGIILKDLRQLDEALIACRTAITLNPHYLEGYCNLGNVLQAKGQLDEAIAAFRQAIALRPGYPDAYYNLGNALQAQAQLDQAIAAYRHALALKPNFPEAQNNLGNALQARGQLDEAVGACLAAITLRPNFPEAHSNLGNALQEQGHLDDAIAAFRQAVSLEPNLAEAHCNLGNALRIKGQLDDAIAVCRRAIVLKPDYAEAYGNLGNALKDMGQLDEAIAAYRQAIALKSNFPEALSNLGNALKDKGQLDEAIAAYRQAIALNPSLPEACCNLGNALKDIGQLDNAIAAYRQAIALNPGYAGAHSNLILTLHYDPDHDPKTIAAEERRWNRAHAEPLKRLIAGHANDRNPDRRLRIGYVSADFLAHASAHFLVPLLQQHDPRQVEVFCYAQVIRPDAITHALQQSAAHWRSTVGFSDEQVARQIRDDRIDLLVDLKMHTAHNRLLVFARKPAPVQVTWLGYPGSTGLSSIDYRLSDPYLDPPGVDESIYSERTIRLPDTFWCYDPLDVRDIPPSALPALNAGIVTFGCLNNFCKMNDGILALWSRVMSEVSGSRLLLLARPGDHRKKAMEFLARHGVAPGRVEFLDLRPRRQYMELYHRIDVGLDSFPSNGHTTSLDSFWMGVPVITLVGQSAVSRAGWCQLSNLGLTELAAQTPEQFVRIAIDLARDLPRLNNLRSTLRNRMEQSPLMDAPRFARNIEAAYRQMWRTWCADASVSRPDNQ